MVFWKGLGFVPRQAIKHGLQKGVQVCVQESKLQKREGQISSEKKRPKRYTSVVKYLNITFPLSAQQKVDAIQNLRVKSPKFIFL